MAAIIRDGRGDDYTMVVNSDGSINAKLKATPTIDIGDIQIKGETSLGAVLPIKVVDDGAGLGKVACSVE